MVAGLLFIRCCWREKARAKAKTHGLSSSPLNNNNNYRGGGGKENLKSENQIVVYIMYSSLAWGSFFGGKR